MVETPVRSVGSRSGAKIGRVERGERCAGGLRGLELLRLDGSDPEEHGRHSRPRPYSEKSSPPMTGCDLHDVLLCRASAARAAAIGAASAPGRCRWRGVPVRDLDLRRLRRAGGRGLGLGDPLDRGEEAFADVVLVGAHRQLELDLVGNDVVLRAAVDRADGDDGRVERVVLAADDRLERDDGSRRDDDRDRPSLCGYGAVAALARRS